jgi:N-acyl-D-amino-acid deacylase
VNLDLLIRGGTLIDGSAGAVPATMDVGVAGERVVAVAPPGVLGAAAVVVEAAGRVVCPGFIDTHVHSEPALSRASERFASLIQGVTTHLTAPDGFGWAGLSPEAADQLWRSVLAIHGPGPAGEPPPAAPTPAAYLAGFRGRLSVDLVPTVPHLAVRYAAMGWRTDAPSAAERAAMAAHVEAWLAEGAVALSVGLDYAPSSAATTDELVGLARLVGAVGGRYVAHGRYRRLGREAALRETLEIGRRAGVGVVISHERVDDAVDAILAERADGDVRFDSHLYPAGCTHLLYHVPEADQAGGPDGVAALLRDRSACERLAGHLDAIIEDGRRKGAREVVAATGSGRWVGRELADVAAEAGLTPGAMAVRMLREEAGDALLVYHWGEWGRTDAEFAPVLARTLEHPAAIVASDGIFRDGQPHPRGYGTFPRVLAWVREHRVTTLPLAIHAMTGRPAETYGLRDRGVVREGALAHLVVLDPATVGSTATWEAPKGPPTGIDAVVLNGRIVVRDGAPTGELAGRVRGMAA